MIEKQKGKLGKAVTDLRENPKVKRALALFQYALLGAIFLYLIYRLTHLGWSDVLGSLPESKWFYVFFALRYLILPVSEIAAYEVVWERGLIRHFPVFVRKRVYNYAVAGYSGEGFLTLWARRCLALSDKKVLIGVKDNNLLAAFTSNVATVLIIVALAATGGLKAGLDLLPGAAVLFGLSFATAGVLVILVVAFRRRLIALPEGKMQRLLAVHSTRQIMQLVLQAAMYSAALPGAPFMAWMLFIGLQLVLSRIPFLPNQDLVYLGAALTLASVVNAPEEAVAGMLVTEAGLLQLLNFTLFFATAHLARQVGASAAPKSV